MLGLDSLEMIYQIANAWDISIEIYSEFFQASWPILVSMNIILFAGLLIYQP